MREGHAARQGSETDTFSCSAAISACEKGKQPDKALERLVDMQLTGLEPDMITSNASVSACEKGEQPDKEGLGAP